MKRGVLIVLSVAVLLVGSAMPAFAARAVGGWGKVFGHSTSCALSRASINSDNERAGGQVHHFEGCTSSAVSRAVPTGYPGVRQVPIRASDNAVCGVMPPWIYHSATTSDLKSSTLVHYWSECPEGAAYQGLTHARRWSEGNAYYVTRTSNFSPAVNFQDGVDS